MTQKTQHQQLTNEELQEAINSTLDQVRKHTGRTETELNEHLKFLLETQRNRTKESENGYRTNVYGYKTILDPQNTSGDSFGDSFGRISYGTGDQ